MNIERYKLNLKPNIGFIYNYIQNVVPFVIDESLDLYNLLRKLVNYCNELGERNNELQYKMKDLVDFLNNKLEEQRQFIENYLTDLYSEYLKYKQQLNEKYENFTQDIEARFSEYKENILNEYNKELDNIRTNNETLFNGLVKLINDKIKELTDYANSIEPTINDYIGTKERLLNELVTSYETQFTEYQSTLEQKLNEAQDELDESISHNETMINDLIMNYKSEIEQEINTKYNDLINSLSRETSNVNTAMNEENLSRTIKEKLQVMNSNGDLAKTINSVFGSVIDLYSLNGEIPSIPLSGETPLYDYNETSRTLTDLTTLKPVLANKNSIYNYKGRLFICADTREEQTEYDIEFSQCIQDLSMNKFLIFKVNGGDDYNGVIEELNLEDMTTSPVTNFFLPKNGVELRLTDINGWQLIKTFTKEALIVTYDTVDQYNNPKIVLQNFTLNEDEEVVKRLVIREIFPKIDTRTSDDGNKHSMLNTSYGIYDGYLYIGYTQTIQDMSGPMDNEERYCGFRIYRIDNPNTIELTPITDPIELFEIPFNPNFTTPPMLQDFQIRYTDKSIIEIFFTEWIFNIGNFQFPYPNPTNDYYITQELCNTAYTRSVSGNNYPYAFLRPDGGFFRAEYEVFILDINGSYIILKRDIDSGYFVNDRFYGANFDFMFVKDPNSSYDIPVFIYPDETGKKYAPVYLGNGNYIFYNGSYEGKPFKITKISELKEISYEPKGV